MDIIEDSITIRSTLKEVAHARQWLAGHAKQADLSDEETSDLQVAISEACTNAIKHAYHLEENHEIILSVVIVPEKVTVTVRDFGCKFSLKHYQPPDLDVPAETGYGIFLMQSLMDIVEFDVSGKLGTELKMVKFRKGAIKDD